MVWSGAELGVRELVFGVQGGGESGGGVERSTAGREKQPGTICSSICLDLTQMVSSAPFNSTNVSAGMSMGVSLTKYSEETIHPSHHIIHSCSFYLLASPHHSLSHKRPGSLYRSKSFRKKIRLEKRFPHVMCLKGLEKFLVPNSDGETLCVVLM